jgi:hypothetical protein
VNPSDSHEVDTTPLFKCSGDSCTCIQKIQDPCTDSGSECGNECELPTTMSCGAAADMFLLTYSRFSELNKGLCSSSGTSIKAGKTVCQAGACGGP